MEATQLISDSISESDEEENKEMNENKKGRPLAKLCILKNEHIPETELPLFLGDNVVGRDPNTCTLPLSAPSISKQHATISLSVYRGKGPHNEVDIEALIWDLGSMNGTSKGHFKLTPNVRYALSERDRLVVADIPCQYVSCTIDTVSSKGYTMTPVSRNSGGNARWPDASGEKGGDTSTGSQQCVNGASRSRVSQPGQEDTRKTQVRTSCLSFEQTPTQPHGTLVPESDSDSDTDKERGERRRKALVSDSDSHIAGPTCSTFLSPTNKIVPESEDESPITPSSSTKNRPSRHVSFSMEEPDVEMGQRQLKNKKTLAIVADSDKEEERAALEWRKSEEGEQHVPGKQESNVSLTGEDETPIFSPVVLTDAIPVFDMDSDTDMEGEEEMVAPAGPVTLNTNQEADQPPNTAQFHMDSDSDVDDENALNEVPKSVPSSADHDKPPHVISVIQAEGITMDSDTDVDDDDVSDAAIKAKPTSLQSSHAADSSSSTQHNDLHLDSDTDIDEEEEKQCGTNNSCSEIDETPSRLDIKPTGPETAPHSLNLDSDTDDEAFPAAAISELSVVSAVTAADAGAVLGVLSDSDTDKEDNSSLIIPVVVSTLSDDLGTTSEALRSDSDADTDVDESSVPPAGGGVNPASFRVDGDTDVEDKEVDFGEAGENQIPSLCREITPGLLVPLQQNCSTPVQTSEEGELEDMETQAFLIPSSRPFRCARPIELSPCTDSLEDDLCVVADTQSFILQTRDCQGNPPEDHNKDPTQSSVDEKGEQCIQGGSFQLGLSDSSHLEGQAQALAMLSTQAFVSVVEGVNLEDTQAYAERTSLENDSNLQANGEDEEPARCPVMSEKEGRVDLALEATQAYISEPNSETDEDERKTTATTETQPFHLPTSSTLAMAETQMFAFKEDKEDEENLDEEKPISSVLQVKSSPQHVTEEREAHVDAAQPQKRHLCGALSVAETQPMHVSENEESDDEDLIPRRRRVKPQQLEEEQTQTLTNSDFSLVETQPMHIGVAETQPMATSGNEESDVEDSIPGPRKSKAKQLWLEDEQTQTLTNSELSTVGTQPMDTGEDGESDEEDSIPAPLEEETQPLTSSVVSVVDTQPLGTCISDQSDEEVSTPGPRKRKAKARQLEEEESQPLTISEVSAVESPPMVVGERRRRKRRAKPIQEEDTQPLINPEGFPVETKTVRQSQRVKVSQTETEPSGTTVGGRRRTRARLREEEEQAGCSEPSKRPTRGKIKALPTTRGRRGKSRPEEEEEEVEQAKCARGKRYTRHQKDSKGEEEMLETEIKNAENTNLIKVQEKGRDEQDKLERERKDKEEQENVQAENAERFRLEQERAEKERKERERKEEGEKKRADRAQKEERLEEERKEKEEKERLDREKAEREEKERIEKEREKEEKEILEREKAAREEERIEKEREKEEKELLEREKAEREEKKRIEKERKKEEKCRLEREKLEREEKERIEKEKKKEEKLRLEREKTEKEENERIEKEKKKEEKLRLEREKAERKEKERIEKERKKEEKLRLEREKAEIEKLEREEKGRTEKERKEEKERVKTTERERKERLERERKEQEEKQEKEAKEKQTKEQQENKKKENNPKTPAKGRRAAPCTTEPHEDSARLAIDDVPARRTRSRSNSSNSVSSEMSASNVTPQGSRGRGRGRATKRTSGPPQAAAARSSNGRRTVAAEPTQQDTYDISPQGVRSRSNSTSSEISSCSLSGGRGGRQRGRGRKTESDSIPPINSQSSQNVAPKPTVRGRKGRRAEESSNEVTKDIEKEKTDSQQASTTRGRQRANANASKPSAGDEKAPSSPECASEDSPLLKRNVRGRVPKVLKSETVETPVAPAVSDGEEAKGKRNGRKRELEVNTDEEANCSSKISKAKEKAQTTEAAKEETKDESRVQLKRKGRASSAQPKKNAKESPAESEVMEESERMEVTVERRGRGRPSVVQKLKKEKPEESGASFDQDTHLEESEPQTPTSSVSRKRQALVDSSPVAKTRRPSSASPAAGGQLQAARQAYKVLFTGVVDEEGERVLACLGGSMAKGVADMTFLVTDKVRRTVKFLCAVAKGVPIVNTHWLVKSGKDGSFLSPNAFVVKDPEQEKKFNFCLQESLRIASSQPLLQGYEIHVTKSVKPEPVHMKDIISCSGATFLPKMPSSHKPQTVVVSCEEDWLLCGPALSASLPVVTAEFILTGILRQKLDLQTHKLSAPANTLQLAGGRGRNKKKT